MAAQQDEVIPPSILFAGDPHGNFRQIIEVVLEYRPKAVIMLGDLTPDRPLEEVVEPIMDMTQIYWIPGNHEGDRDIWYDYTFNSALSAKTVKTREIIYTFFLVYTSNDCICIWSQIISYQLGNKNCFTTSFSLYRN